MLEMNKVIVGSKTYGWKPLIACLVKVTFLLEGVPGLAKNSSYKYTSKSSEELSRIQFTPDFITSRCCGLPMIF